MGFEWGGLNVLGTGLSSFINPRASVLTTVSLSLLINHVPSAIGLFLDHLKSRGNIGGVYG